MCVVHPFMYTNAIIHRKRDERVDWLYGGPSHGLNREEYLLGKRIDHLTDPMLKEEEKEVDTKVFLVG